MSNVITPVKTEERSKLGVRSGDTVRVHQRIIERGKTRIQNFEGLVISVKHGTEAGATFTVRATLSGIGVEKIFPLYAPFIEKIEIVRRSKVRRAKLYFIREKVSREVRRQLRNMRMVNISTDDFTEEVPVVDESQGATEEVVLTSEVDESAVEPVTVEEVQEADPAHTPSGEEMTPAQETAGEPEAPVVEEKETPA
jgi:large subunit ribosomal protein L19